MSIDTDLKIVTQVVRVVEPYLTDASHITPVIAGGAARDLLFRETPKDYDVFFFTEDIFSDDEMFKLIARIFDDVGTLPELEKLTLHQAYDQSAGDFNKNHQAVIKISCSGVNIDIIFTRHRNPIELITYFDFSVNRCYMEFDSNGEFSTDSGIKEYDSGIVELRNSGGYDLAFLYDDRINIPAKCNRVMKFWKFAVDHGLRLGPIVMEIVDAIENRKY